MPDIGYEVDFLLSLLQTVTIETIVLFFLIRYLYRQPIQTDDILFVGIICSFATLPYVWFIFPLLKMIGSYTLYIWSAEITVALIETMMIRKLLNISYKQALNLSVVANLASWGSGFVF